MGVLTKNACRRNINRNICSRLVIQNIPRGNDLSLVPLLILLYLELEMSENVTPQPSVVSLNPDQGSGNDFMTALKNAGLPTVTGIEATISPRVVNGELTPRHTEISKQLYDYFKKIAEEFKPRFNDDVLFLTISCNTLSLQVFVHEAFERLGEDIEDFDTKVQAVLNIDSIVKHCEKSKDQVIKTVVLGTKPLQKILADTYPDKVQTFANFKGATDNDLELVQEIIWRVKAIQGSDTSTAPKKYEGQLDDEKTLRKKVKELEEIIQQLGISEIVMGCTELPTAFLQYGDSSRTFNLVNPAELVAQEINARFNSDKNDY